jgi:hypothetical protein
VQQGGLGKTATAVPSVTVMPTQVSAVQMATAAEEGCVRGSRNGEGIHQAVAPLAVRVHGEYREMPGLRLTVRQAARLFSVAPDVAEAVLHELRRASVLPCSDDGAFSLIGEPSRGRTAVLAVSEATAGTDHMSAQVDVGAAVNESLRDASLDRLACLLRHWTWADEAMATFDRELANGWDYDDDPMSDHPVWPFHRSIGPQPIPKSYGLWLYAGAFSAGDSRQGRIATTDRCGHPAVRYRYREHQSLDAGTELEV